MADLAKSENNKVEKQTPTENVEAKLDTNSALQKYFYPTKKSIINSLENVDKLCEEKEKLVKQNVKPKHRKLKMLFKVLASVALSFAARLVLYTKLPIQLNILKDFLITAGSSAVLFGVIQGSSLIINKIKNVVRKKKQLALLNTFKTENLENNKALKEMFKNLEEYKSVTDIEKLSTQNINKTMLYIAQLNNNLFSSMKKMYNLKDNTKVQNILDKYVNIEDCYKNPQEIISDLSIVKKELGSLQLNTPNIPEIFDEKENTVISSSVVNLEKKLPTIIPFIQVVNATYEKTKAKHEEQEERARQKERIREQIRQQEIDKENEKLKNFFSEFGINEELKN